MKRTSLEGEFIEIEILTGTPFVGDVDRMRCYART